jgi:hypothetical protein
MEVNCILHHRLNKLNEIKVWEAKRLMGRKVHHNGFKLVDSLESQYVVVSVR